MYKSYRNIWIKSDVPILKVLRNLFVSVPWAMCWRSDPPIWPSSDRYGGRYWWDRIHSRWEILVSLKYYLIVSFIECHDDQAILHSGSVECPTSSKSTHKAVWFEGNRWWVLNYPCLLIGLFWFVWHGLYASHFINIGFKSTLLIYMFFCQNYKVDSMHDVMQFAITGVGFCCCHSLGDFTDVDLLWSRLPMPTKW